jgi:hypothetical protein
MPTITPQTSPQAQAFDMTGGGAPPQGIEQPTQSEALPRQETAQPSISPQLEQLARRERQIRQQARALQAEKQALSARQADYEKSLNSQWKQKIASNPWDTMIEAGLTPDQATQIILNKPKPEDLEFKRIQRELEQLKTSQEESRQQMAAQQQAQYDEARRHMTMEAKLLVDADNTYQPIKAMGAEDSIPQLIEDVFHKGLPDNNYRSGYKYPRGYIMSVEESAQLVNDYLIDEGVRIAKLEAVQARMRPPQNSIDAQRQMSQMIQASTPTRTNANYNISTLSNRMTASQPTSSTDRERRERAILAYQGRLNN